MAAPMPPEKLEELFRQMNEPKVAHTLPAEDEDGDDLEEHLARFGLTSGLDKPQKRRSVYGCGPHRVSGPKVGFQENDCRSRFSRSFRPPSRRRHRTSHVVIGAVCRICGMAPQNSIADDA